MITEEEYQELLEEYYDKQIMEEIRRERTPEVDAEMDRITKKVRENYQKNLINKKVRVDQEENITKYYLICNDEWEYMEVIADYLVKEHGAVIDNKQEAPYFSRWQIYLKGEYFYLEYDTMLGHFYYSCLPEGDSPLMYELALDLADKINKREL